MKDHRKVAIIGTGNVGAATAAAVLGSHRVHEIVLIDKKETLAQGVAADMRYGAVFGARPTVVRAGSREDLEGCSVVVVTAGVNEKAGGATDPNDPVGRLRLAEPNRDVYAEWAPAVADQAPEAVFLAVTDPPDPLADLAATLCPELRVISAGTLIDTNRFRHHLGEELDANPNDVDGVVLGEHGRSAVQLWSQARVEGEPVADRAERLGKTLEAVREAVSKEVALANIKIISGTGASQYGIGVVAARIVTAIVDDQKCLLPVGSRANRFGVTLSLPSVVGRAGVLRAVEPPMTTDEASSLERSSEVIWEYSKKIGAKKAVG